MYAYGSLTSTRPCIETSAWRSEDREGLHDSLRSPSQVPRIDRHTLPSSYKFGLTLPFPVTVRVSRRKYIEELRGYHLSNSKSEQSVGNEGSRH